MKCYLVERESEKKGKVLLPHVFATSTLAKGFIRDEADKEEASDSYIRSELGSMWVVHRIKVFELHT